MSRNLIGSGGSGYSYASNERVSNWETRNASGSNWFYFYQAYEFDSWVNQGLRNRSSSSSSWSSIELSYALMSGYNTPSQSSWTHSVMSNSSYSTYF